MRSKLHIYIFTSLLSIALIAAFTSAASAQRRDYITDQELELVRDAQDIDVRIDVLTRMIDRRFDSLGIAVGGWKQKDKDSDIWGEMPKGTRLELLSDVKKLLQKTIDDIDNLSAHPSSAPVREKGDREAKKDPERFSTAVRSLGTAASRYLGPLKSELEKTRDEKEKGLILDSIDFCSQILEAVGKLPAEVKKR